MRKLPVLATAVAALAAQTSAYAGYHSTSPVAVYKNSGNPGGIANGSVYSARYYTSDSTQYIGCQSVAYPGSSGYVFCSATDSKGNYLSCMTSNADDTTRTAIASVNTSSFILFQADTSGKCSIIAISNFSYTL